jgi:hypothetical protein
VTTSWPVARKDATVILVADLSLKGQSLTSLIACEVCEKADFPGSMTVTPLDSTAAESLARIGISGFRAIKANIEEAE